MIKFICAYVGERTFELRNRAKVLFYKIVVNADFINLYEIQTGVTVSFTDVTKLVDMLETSYPKNGVSKIGLLRSIAKVAGFKTVRHISNGIYTTTDECVSYGGTFNVLVGTYEREIKNRAALIEKLGTGVEKFSSMERAFIQFMQEVKDTPKEKRVTRAKIDKFKIFLRCNGFATNIQRSKTNCKIVYECLSMRFVATFDLMFARADSYPHTGTPKITAGLIIYAKDSEVCLLSINAIFAYSDAMSSYIGWLDDFTKMLASNNSFGSIEPNDILAQIVHFITECKTVR